MSVAHLSVDMLSAYIDRELSDRELARVEGHLEDCVECRHQLDSLGRVVGRLRGLERMAPPQLLEMDVQRRVALTSPRRSLFDDFDARLGRLPVQPGILVTFALVFAFAAILFTFAEGLKERRPETIPVLLGPSSSSVERVPLADGQEPVTEVSAWVWNEGWVEAPTTEAVSLKVVVGSQEWLELLTRQPQLGTLDLASATTRVRLTDGAMVEIQLAGTRAGGDEPTIQE